MAATALKLHSFFNSSASYRVRIALNLKGLKWEHVGVNIRTGAQNVDTYRRLNPAALVPTLEHNAYSLTQSLVIIDYLDRMQREPLLVPSDGRSRDRALEIAQLVACDIHPINNLRVLKYLTGVVGLTEAQKNAWIAHWIGLGFDAVEKLIHADEWCVGGHPTIADCCLIPQVANARRAGVDINRWPLIAQVETRASTVAAFVAAAPDKQPDYVSA